MIRMSHHERELARLRSAQEEIKCYEQIYQRGAGCFGVRRRSPEVKKELERLKKKLRDL